MCLALCPIGHVRVLQHMKVTTAQGRTKTMRGIGGPMFLQPALGEEQSTSAFSFQEGHGGSGKQDSPQTPRSAPISLQDLDAMGDVASNQLETLLVQAEVGVGY